MLSIERDSFRTVVELDNLEVLHARRLTRRYVRHFHTGYAFGVIDEGALGFDYRGNSLVAGSGNISLVIPGEVHTGYPLDADGWSYRMLYMQPSSLSAILTDLGGKPGELPFFPMGVINDRDLADRLRSVHALLSRPGTPLLEMENNLQTFLREMVLRYAINRTSPVRPKAEPVAVKQVRQYLDENYALDVSIDELCRLTNLTRYHLVHTFSRQVGLPPFAYQRQVRLQHAREWLREGYSISMTAALTGFADQSHLTRWFKQTWGMTPGEYRNSVQYPLPL